jgi:hypothetical protein
MLAVFDATGGDRPAKDRERDKCRERAARRNDSKAQAFCA